MLRIDWEMWALTVKNLIWPMFCRHCGVRLLTEDNRFFCPTCWERSPRIIPPLCSKCGKPHEQILGFGPVASYPCDTCRNASPRTIRYRRILGAAHYQDAIAEAIKLFKFHDRTQLAGPLAELMLEAADRELDMDGYHFIIPVPLYRVRERARGYNQSLLLAEEIAPYFEGAAIDHALKRIRPTKTQSRLKSEAERRENVRGAFAVDNGDRLKGKKILLIDDVVTTGVTVNECAAVLRRHGVEHVDVLAVALAVKQRPLTQRMLPIDESIVARMA